MGFISAFGFPLIYGIFPLSKRFTKTSLSMQANKHWKSNFLLLITALIWGFAFVAQRLGMEYMEPFTFNGMRFAVGTLSLLPVVLFLRSKQEKTNRSPVFCKTGLQGGLFLGAALFLGASFQQVGLVYTTAGKAGFITGLYVIIVPLLGLFWKQSTNWSIWVGAFLAVAGMFLLSVTEDFTISRGDLLVLGSAFFWAAHVQLIAHFSKKYDVLLLSLYQFIFCSLFSFLLAINLETIVIQNILAAKMPLFVTGVLSVGVAYTLQTVAQKDAHPAHAAIILSLESVFAVLGGWLFLNEILSLRGFLGCLLMLTGMLISQLFTGKRDHALL
jgi:drug/metabolite transporter (DMT)-like permease